MIKSPFKKQFYLFHKEVISEEDIAKSGVINQNGMVENR